MKITADTNVLLRLILADDEAQSLTAVETMESASLVAISTHSLCELAWVLSTRAAMPRQDIASAIRGLIDARNVVVNRPAIEAGLAVLNAGGDFADGVIAFDGQWLGGETFVSFDKKAVALLGQQGTSARLL
ncbi:MAG: type II toxin-antitoxin system VapC family toxin [Vicinamibacterales bacterium]